jgi:hypothetical protein
MTKQNLSARWTHLRLPLPASLLAALMALPAHATTMEFFTPEEQASRLSDSCANELRLPDKEDI